MPGRRPAVALLEASGRGGLAHFAFCFAEALAARGHAVTLLTAKHYELADRPRRFEVRQVFDRLRTSPLRLWRALREADAKVLHLHGAAHPELYGPLLALLRLLGYSVVFSVHDPTPRQWSWFPQWFLRGLFRLPQVLMAHSQAAASRLEREFRVPREKLAIVPHGHYGFLATLEAEREPTAWPEDIEPRALFFGFILPQKGLADLIEAFDVVRRRLPGARLCIAGQPVGSAAEYERRIGELGLADRVTLSLGYVPLAAVSALFRSSQVVVLPYRIASQSGVLLAAYAFGRPVIATACAGLAEFVRHGQTGLLVPPGDPAALADALVELLGDRERCRRLGQEGRAWSERELSWDRVAARAAESYESVLTRGPAVTSGVTS